MRSKVYFVESRLGLHGEINMAAAVVYDGFSSERERKLKREDDEESSER